MRARWILVPMFGLLLAAIPLVRPSQCAGLDGSSSEFGERSVEMVVPAVLERPDTARPGVKDRTRRLPQKSSSMQQFVAEIAGKRTGRSFAVLGESGGTQGLILPRDSVSTVTFTAWPPSSGGGSVTTVQIPAGKESFLPGYCFTPFDNIEIPVGLHEIRVDGRPCLLQGLPREGKPWLFVPDKAFPLTVYQGVSGCMGSRHWNRIYLRSDDAYCSLDGSRVPIADVDALRARVLDSRLDPGESRDEILRQPDAFLATLGFTDGEIARRLPDLRLVFARSWHNADELLRASSAELDARITVERVKRELAEYLLLSYNASTTDYAAWIELPGDPWICLAADSNRPGWIPWYAGAEGETWHVLDRELSRSICALGGPDGWLHANVGPSADWNEALWREARAWSKLEKEVDEILAHTSYRLVPGWERIQQRLEPYELVINPSAIHPLPVMKLRVLEPGVIDQVSLAPSATDSRDWNDVLADLERVEGLVSANPWFARSKLQNPDLRLGVRLPAGVEGLVEPQAIRTAWSEILGEGQPDFILFFGCVAPMDGRQQRFNVGTACLSETGTLLIVDSSGSRGPLASIDPARCRLLDTGRYGLVRPDGTFEVGVLER